MRVTSHVSETSTSRVNAPTLNANFTQSATTVVVRTTVTSPTPRRRTCHRSRVGWDFGDWTPHVFTSEREPHLHDAGVRTVPADRDRHAGHTSAFHTNTVTVNAPTINANFNQSATSVVVEYVSELHRYLDDESAAAPGVGVGLLATARRTCSPRTRITPS